MTTHPTPTLFMIPRQRVAELPWEPMPGATGVEHRVLFEDERSVAGLLRLHPGAEELAHLHLHGEHHLWVLSGTVSVDETLLPADSYLHVPARLTHRVVDTGAGSLLFYVFATSND
ncbi:MAG TPA: cupin domain-containing protein [Mycobacteriales bacterium]|nr:cupin domain-containing protein [Mycobacteriales bacterium]